MSRAAGGATLLVLALVACLGEANFRGSKGLHSNAASRASLEQVRSTLLQQIRGGDFLNGSRRATETNMAALEAGLRPIFAALPKNDEGLLGHATVRYALHRYFVQRHGWLVKGLAGGSWSTSNATSILQDRVPAYVQDLFEQRLSGHGLGLHDLAVLAATLEHLVHDDSVSRLQAAYRLLGLPLDADNGEERVGEAIEAFMMMFVLAEDVRTLDETEFASERANILDKYPTWNDTKDFVAGVYRNVTGHGVRPAAGRTMGFEEAERVVEALQDRYGSWQNRECEAMKRELLESEEGGSGRVRLSDFYAKKKFVFTESPEYLRHLGALDESDPARPRVIVANYVYSPTNCLAASGFYDVCCMNECEGILAQIERELATPTPSPQELAALLPAVPSATVATPRKLSAALLRRLEEIAEANGGQVPLHGRLFSQWLHHAFPRECPYPHAAATASPMRPEEWLEQTGQDPLVAQQVLEEHLDAAGRREHGGEGAAAVESVPWTADEELIHDGRAPRAGGGLWSPRALAKWAVLFAAAAMMLRGVLKDAWPARGAKSSEMYLLPVSVKEHLA